MKEIITLSLKKKMFEDHNNEPTRQNILNNRLGNDNLSILVAEHFSFDLDKASTILFLIYFVSRQFFCTVYLLISPLKFNSE